MSLVPAVKVPFWADLLSRAKFPKLIVVGATASWPGPELTVVDCFEAEETPWQPTSASIAGTTRRQPRRLNRTEANLLCTTQLSEHISRSV